MIEGSLAVLPEALDVSFKTLPAALTIIMLILFIAIGWIFRVTGVSDLWVAGRSIGSIENGMAIAANWMSAASYLGMAGLIGLLGFFGLAYIVGWSTGYFILLVFMAAQFRRFGKYTAPDFAGDRYYSDYVRALAALTTLLIGFVYAVGQGRGLGLMSMYIFGTDYATGVVLFMVIVLLYVVFSGMLGATKNMAVQYVILIIAFLAGLAGVASALGYNPFVPQISYGAAMTELYHEVSKEITQPFANASPYMWVATTFTLIAGTCGLPHVLVRFYTVANEKIARWSTVWGLFFILILYLSAPAFSAFGNELFFELTGNFPMSGDEADVIVVLASQLAELPQWLVGFVAAGGVAAALATVAGLFVTASSAAAHDIYTCIIKDDASQREQLIVGRITILLLGIAVTIVSIDPPALIAELVGMAFAIAAAILFPIFFLGLWWERTTKEGAISGMVLGLVISGGAIINNWYIGIEAIERIVPATSSALVAVPLVFITIIVVSILTEDPPEDVKRMVRQCHSPEPMQKLENANDVVEKNSNS